MHENFLDGCTPEPLMSYLKALGVLRLVSRQLDADAHGTWRHDRFVLETRASAEELKEFFLTRYTPTPILAPWNGGSGFYGSGKKAATIEALRSSGTTRLADYRTAVAVADRLLVEQGLTAKPKDDEKVRLLEALRGQWPESAVRALDTAVRLTENGAQYPALTGTGWNDGNLEFSRTFIERLLELIDPETGEPRPIATALLDAALFGAAMPGLSSTTAGQFLPAGAGVVNSGPGFKGKVAVNPWDYVLGIEGTLLFTAAATRRLERTGSGDVSYPFSVRPAGLGYASAAEADATNGRAELWAPMWSRPATLRELEVLFGEGRAKVGRRTARTGVDFARALAGLGVQRGLSGFVRYGFHVRNGLSYFATPLGRFRPRRRPELDLLGSIDGWLTEVAFLARKEATPASVRAAHHRLEHAILDQVQGRGAMTEVLVALGALEAVLDRSRHGTDIRLPPIPWLPGHDWWRACDDGSTEYRLATALAATGLRRRLVQVDGEGRWSDDARSTVWGPRDVVTNLLAVLAREAAEAAESNSDQAGTRRHVLGPSAGADALAAFIAGHTDDLRIEALARGLSLLRAVPPLNPQRNAALPAAFALMRLVHADWLPPVASKDALHLPRTPQLLARGSSGDARGALEAAVRRLRGAGLDPIAVAPFEPARRLRRMTAALAFPVSEGTLRQLMQHHLRLPDQDERLSERN